VRGCSVGLAGWTGRLLWSRLLRVGKCKGVFRCVLLLLGLNRLDLVSVPCLSLFSLHKDTCAAREEKVQLPAAAAAVLVLPRRSVPSLHTRDAARSGERAVEIFCQLLLQAGEYVYITSNGPSRLARHNQLSSFPSFADRDITGIETRHLIIGVCALGAGDSSCDDEVAEVPESWRRPVRRMVLISLHRPYTSDTC
jgi:hypothetical protein